MRKFPVTQWLIMTVLVIVLIIGYYFRGELTLPLMYALGAMLATAALGYSVANLQNVVVRLNDKIKLLEANGEQLSDGTVVIRFDPNDTTEVTPDNVISKLHEIKG